MSSEFGGLRDSISAATVARLPLYLRALSNARAAGRSTLSSVQLAAESGVNAANIRKDLSHLGVEGRRGLGYHVTDLYALLSRALGVGTETGVVIVGAGYLGQALARYRGLGLSGFRVEALVDVDPAKIGTSVDSIPIIDGSELKTWVLNKHITTAIVATPADNAQSAVTQLVKVGITAIMNMAPVAVEVPDGVVVRTVDLSTEMQILSFYRDHR